MPITFTRPMTTQSSAGPSVQAAGIHSPTGSPDEVTPTVLAAAAAVSPQTAATVSEQRSHAGAVLVELFQYLDANAEAHPALAPAISLLASAVAQWRTGTSADPFAGVRAVYDAIQSVRRDDPSVPDA